MVGRVMGRVAVGVAMLFVCLCGEVGFVKLKR